MSDTLNAAIASAVSETTSEIDTGSGETTTEAGPATESTPGADAAPAPAAAPPKPEPDEDFKLSAVELDLVNKSPELRKAYRSMVKGFTAKTTALAETRKSLEEKAKIADWIQSDPDAAVETLARMRGKTLAQAKV